MSLPARPAPLPSSTVATLLLALMVAVEFSGASGVLEDRLPVSLYLVLLAAGMLVVVWRSLRQRVAVPWATVAAMSAYLLATALSSLLSDLDGRAFLRTGVEPDWGAAAVTGALKELVFVVVVCLLASGLRRWWLLAAAMVVPMALICVLSGVNEWLLGNAATFGGFETVTTAQGVGVVTKRHGGPLPDANFWGRFLVLGLPFATALTHDALRRGRRLLATVPAGCILAMLLGVYLTGSRGTMIGALLGVAVYLLLSGIDRRTLVIGAAVVLPVMMVLPGVGSRMLSMLGLADDGQLAAVDGSMRERIATQTVATKMIEAHPLTGVGPGGYFARFPDYAAATDLHLERIVAPHNLYLGLWAEIGVVGLLAFLSILAVALRQGRRVLLAAPDVPGLGRDMRPYAAAVVGGLVAWCVASVFLHLTYARVAYLVVGLAAGMAAQVRAMGWQPAPRPARRPFPWVLVPLGATGAAIAAMAVSLAPTTGQASVIGYLQPRVDDPYVISLRTREVTAPTYAVLAGVFGKGQVDVQGDPSSGLVSVSATGRDAEEARRAAEQAITHGDAAVRKAGLDTLFTTRWQQVYAWDSAPGTTEVVKAMCAGTLAGVGAGVVGLAVLGVMRHRRRTDRMGVR